MKRIKITWSTEREVLAALVIVFVLVVLGGIVTYRQMTFYDTTLTNLDRSRQIASTSEVLYRSLLNVETNQRNYLVTGDTVYLEPYIQGVQDVQVNRARLLVLINESSTSVDGIDFFIAQVDEQLNDLARMLEIRRDSGFEAAQAALAANSNKVLMDEVLNWLDALILSETQHFESVRNRVANRVGITTIAMLLLITLILSLAAAVYTLVRRDMRAHRALEDWMSKTLHRERELSELKSHFVRTVSHEFRTPLAVIQTSTDLLSRYGHLMTETQRQDHTAKLQNQIVRLTSLIEDALTVQRSQFDDLPFIPSSNDLSVLCRRRIAALQEEFGQRRIDLVLEGDSFDACVDAHLLSQAIDKLLVNALRFSDPGAAVRVELRTTPQSALISVIDAGVGIPDDEHAHIFDLFFRGHNAKDVPGAGMGLTVARSIVALHHGNIRVDSTPALGSTFTIELPLTQPTVEGAA